MDGEVQRCTRERFGQVGLDAQVRSVSGWGDGHTGEHCRWRGCRIERYGGGGGFEVGCAEVGTVYWGELLMVTLRVLFGRKRNLGNFALGKRKETYWGTKYTVCRSQELVMYLVHYIHT